MLKHLLVKHLFTSSGLVMVTNTTGNKCHEPCREASAAALAWLSSDDAQSGTSSQLQSLLLAVQDGILTHLPLPLRGADATALRC
jgi:hypothetical protein